MFWVQKACVDKIISTHTAADPKVPVGGRDLKVSGQGLFLNWPEGGTTRGEVGASPSVSQSTGTVEHRREESKLERSANQREGLQPLCSPKVRWFHLTLIGWTPLTFSPYYRT